MHRQRRRLELRLVVACLILYFVVGYAVALFNGVR